MSDRQPRTEADLIAMVNCPDCLAGSVLCQKHRGSREASRGPDLAGLRDYIEEAIRDLDMALEALQAGATEPRPDLSDLRKEVEGLADASLGASSDALIRPLVGLVMRAAVLALIDKRLEAPRDPE